MFKANLNHFQSVYAHQFFVAPADQNYFLARFAKTYGMHEEFWWQSLQAIEKLLKAGLILNGVSVKEGFGHNLIALWQAHSKVFGELAVSNLSKPDILDPELWDDAPLERFIQKVNRTGDPNTRYGLVGYANSSDDIFKLDQLVCELRRRTIGLDWIVGNDWQDESLIEFSGSPYSAVIEHMPDHQIRKMKIPTGEFETIGKSLEDVHHAWNFAFRRDSADLRKKAPASVSSRFGGFGNSHLYLLWESLEREAITPDIREKVEWLLDNIFIGKATEKAFRKALSAKVEGG